MPVRQAKRPALLQLDEQQQRALMAEASAQIKAELALRDSRPSPDAVEPAEVPPDGLIEFTEHFYPGYRAGAVHRVIADTIEEALAQRDNPPASGVPNWYMIFVSPQHGKSELVSVQAPAWHLSTHPDDHWVNASYASSLSDKHSRYARDIVRSAEYGRLYPGTRPSLTTNAVDEWEIAGHRGGMKAVGVGGGLTGRRADIMVIDDPVAGRKEANSETVRESTWDWWRGVARTRLSPNAIVILVMTRWHFGDLAGRILEEDKLRTVPRWKVIRIPARCDDEEHDPLGRKHGEVSWPERFDTTVQAEAFYDELQRDLGPIEWASLGQQVPSLGEDALFKPAYWDWYQPGDLPDARMSNRGFLFIVQTWDTAYKEKQRNDFNASVTVGVDGRGIWLLDVYNQRHEMPGLLAAGERQHTKWGPTHLFVENKASGPSMAQMLKVATKRISVQLWEPIDGGDKIARAQAVVPICASGMVHIPATDPETGQPPPWLDAFLVQLYQFPAGEHDDMVDAFVMALQIAKDLLEGKRRVGVVSGYTGGTQGGGVAAAYVDTDTGRAPSPDVVRRRQ